MSVPDNFSHSTNWAETILRSMSLDSGGGKSQMVKEPGLSDNSICSPAEGGVALGLWNWYRTFCSGEMGSERAGGKPELCAPCWAGFRFWGELTLLGGLPYWAVCRGAILVVRAFLVQK